MHTLCLPVVSSLSDVYAGADVQAVVCLLANMGEYRPGRFTWFLHVLVFVSHLNEVVNEAWILLKKVGVQHTEAYECKR